MDMKKIIALTGAVVAIVVIMIAVSMAPQFSSGSMYEEDPVAVVDELTGDVSINHAGLNYTLKEGIGLCPGDKVLVGRNSSCGFEAAGLLSAHMNYDSTAKILKTSDGLFELSIEEGSVFMERPSGEGETVTVSFGKCEVVPSEGAVFSCEVYPGSQTVNCYSGELEFSGYGKRFTVSASENVIVAQVSAEVSVYKSKIVLSELRDDLLLCILESGIEAYDPGEIEDILSARQTETAMRLPDEDDADGAMYATIEIRCDTVLPGLEEMPSALAKVIPRDGIILAETKVPIEYGQTVFDLLYLVCTRSDIELDYKYLPLIKGYYITGIGGLSEFDCGKSSGWLYRVNGWYPNYGCYSCYLKSGDKVVFAYTCDGYGRDIGRDEDFDPDEW